MIELHYLGSPNGIKIALMLEELGWRYRLTRYDIFTGDHLTPQFRKLNPNSKVPVLVDDEPEGGGAPFPVFETGAILIYLAEKSGRYLAAGGLDRSRALQWLIWQVSALGPMMGQARHFLSYAPEGQTYATERYLREVQRLFNVLETRLREVPFLAGDYSIADIATWPWALGAQLLGMDLSDLPAVQRWMDMINAREAVRRMLGRDDLKLPEHYLRMKATLTEEEWSNLFGEKMHAASKAWSNSGPCGRSDG